MKTTMFVNDFTSSIEQNKIAIASKDLEYSYIYLDSLVSPCLEIGKSYSNLSDIYTVASSSVHC